MAMRSLPRSRPVVTITGVVYALIGLALAGGGAWLAALGGSLYYLLAGIGILLTGLLLIGGPPVRLVGLCRRADRHAAVGDERHRLRLVAAGGARRHHLPARPLAADALDHPQSRPGRSRVGLGMTLPLWAGIVGGRGRAGDRPCLHLP